MTSKSQSFRAVVAWQKAHAFALALDRGTGGFPSSERHGLVSRLRRAAGSIPSNSVEGFRKRTKADKLRFDNMAQGSADECVHQLVSSHDLGHADIQALQ